VILGSAIIDFMKERIKTEFKSNTAHYVSLFVLFLTGFGLRLYYLITSGVENDEIFSYTVYASRPLSFGLTHYDTNNHPLNTLLVHPTTRIFGNNLMVIRFWVFICGIAVLPLLYLVIRRLYNKEAALLGVALAVPPTVLVNYTVYARGYGLQVAIFLLLVLVALRIKETGKGWLWYVVLTVMGFYAVLTFIYCIGVVFFYLLFSAIFRDVCGDEKRFTFKLVLSTVVAGVVTALTYLPFIIESGLKAITENPFVKSQPLGSFLGDVPTLLNNIYHAWSEDWWVWMMPLLIAGFVLSIIFNRRISKTTVSLPLVMVGWFLVVFLGQRVLIFSRVIIPFYPVFLGCSAAGLYFVGHAAFEWVRQKRKYVERPFVFSLLAIGVAALMIINNYPKTSAYGSRESTSAYTGFNYRTIAEVLKTRVGEGDVVYGDFFMVNPLTYEFERAGIPLRHLYKNFKNVRTIPPGEVERAFIITDIAYNTLPSVLDYTGLEYNDSFPVTEYLHGDAVGAKNTLFEIMVVPVTKPTATTKLETSFKPVDKRTKKFPCKVLGTGSLLGVHMLDETHSWAVGKKGRVAFFDGSNWKAETVGTKTDLTGVYASNPDEVYIVGAGGTAFHYRGKWMSVPTPVTTGLRGISGVDSSHVWAVGTSGCVIFFDGQKWSVQDSGVSWNINGVSALDPNHVWAVGSGGILFFDGQRWSSQWEAGNSALFPGLNGVFALDKNQVWAVGSIQGGFSSSVLFFDGHRWVVQFDQFGAGLAGTASPATRDFIEPLKSVYVSSPDKVYTATELAVVTFDGNRWHIRKTPNEFFSALSGFENEVIGVGYRMGYDNLTNRTIYQAAVYDLP
jgi:hypothetical protein